MHLYVNVVRQASQIFDMGATSASGLINAIKKDKSFEMKLWIKYQVNQFVAAIERHVKDARVERSRCKERLKQLLDIGVLRSPAFFAAAMKVKKPSAN